MNFSKNKTTSLNVIKKHKIKVLLKDPRNRECFECSNYEPEYISLNNGIFLCENCINNHKNLPKSISNIVTNNLYNLTLNEIQYLCCGGNQKLKNFIKSEYPNLRKLSPEYFYQTYAMDYYRKCLEYLIEGGIKPTRPDIDKAYELLNKNIVNKYSNNKDNINNFGKKKKLFNKIKSESYMKTYKNRYPKIKPIIGGGRKNSFQFSKSIERENRLNLTTIGNSNYSYENDDFYNYNYGNHRTLKSDFKRRFLSSQFNEKKYDTDDVIREKKDKNNITDINEITEFNEEDNNLTEYNEGNQISQNIKIKIKKRIHKKDKFDTNIKVLRNSNISPNNNYNTNNIGANNNDFKKTIYSKPIYQNYLSSFYGPNFDNINKNEFNEYKTNQTEGKSELISSIDNFRKYYFSNNKNKINNNGNRYIFHLKQSNTNTNDYQNKDNNKLNINNINNNIIINKNLNIYYNNNLQKIFKKKTIGNSFSINDKKQKSNYINSINNTNNYMDNLFKIKNKYKNEWNKNLRDNKDTYISENKIKVNRQNKNINTINNINSIITENKYLKFDNEKEDIDLKQKSKIIERISRVLKTQKERELKKSNEKIKLNQNQKDKEDYIKVNNNNENNNNDKIPKENKNEKIITTPIDNNDIIKDQRKKNNLSIKELINISSSKKRNILDLIKSNNLANPLVSPDSKKLMQIHTDPKRIPKTELNSKTSIREMYKRKKNNF